MRLEAEGEFLASGECGDGEGKGDFWQARGAGAISGVNLAREGIEQVVARAGDGKVGGEVLVERDSGGSRGFDEQSAIDLVAVGDEEIDVGGG